MTYIVQVCRLLLPYRHDTALTFCRRSTRPARSTNARANLVLQRARTQIRPLRQVRLKATLLTRLYPLHPFRTAHPMLGVALSSRLLLHPMGRSVRARASLQKVARPRMELEGRDGVLDWLWLLLAWLLETWYRISDCNDVVVDLVYPHDITYMHDCLSGRAKSDITRFDVINACP